MDPLDTWVQHMDPSGEYDYLWAVAFGGGQYVAVGLKDILGVGGPILTSNNGIDWVRREPASSPGEAVRGSAVAYGNGQFVVEGYDNTTWTSTDGTNWVQSTPGFGYSWISYGNGQFVAAGWDGIATSTDGVNWAQPQEGPQSRRWALLESLEENFPRLHKSPSRELLSFNYLDSAGRFHQIVARYDRQLYFQPALDRFDGPLASAFPVVPVLFTRFR